MKDGGPAFPAIHSIDGNWVKEPLEEFRGMSLRDYFAAAALQGVLQDRENVKRIAEEADGEKTERGLFLASRCYILADAMLAEREKS